MKKLLIVHVFIALCCPFIANAAAEQESRFILVSYEKMLLDAATNGDLINVQHAISRGAAVQSPCDLFNLFQDSPVYQAVIHKQPHITQFFIENKYCQLFQIKHVISLLMNNRYPDIATTIESVPLTNESATKLLYSATYNDFFPAFRPLLAKGANPNTEGVIASVFRGKQNDLINYLVDLGADREEVIAHAVLFNDYNTASQLLRSHPNKLLHLKNHLIKATTKDNKEMVALLLEHEVNKLLSSRDGTFEPTEEIRDCYEYATQNSKVEIADLIKHWIEVAAHRQKAYEAKVAFAALEIQRCAQDTKRVLPRYIVQQICEYLIPGKTCGRWVKEPSTREEVAIARTKGIFSWLAQTRPAMFIKNYPKLTLAGLGSIAAASIWAWCKRR